MLFIIRFINIVSSKCYVSKQINQNERLFCKSYIHVHISEATYFTLNFEGLRELFDLTVLNA